MIKGFIPVNCPSHALLYSLNAVISMKRSKPRPTPPPPPPAYVYGTCSFFLGGPHILARFALKILLRGEGFAHSFLNVKVFKILFCIYRFFELQGPIITWALDASRKGPLLLALMMCVLLYPPPYLKFLDLPLCSLIYKVTHLNSFMTFSYIIALNEYKTGTLH